MSNKLYLSNILPETVKISINNIIKIEQYIEYEVEDKPISTHGGSFLGILAEVNIKGKTEFGDKEINVFVKHIPKDIFSFATHLPPLDIYNRESFVYNELLPIYEVMQDRYGIPDEDRFKTAKIYYASTEAILLENLSKKGFKTVDRMKILPIRFAELSVAQLAKFHALSIVLEKEKPEYFEKLKVIETYFKGKKFINFFKSVCTNSFKNLNHEYREKLEKVLDACETRLKRHFDLSKKLVCICHGDFRANNILYKDGELQQVIPVDFQLLHYGSPLNDFTFFIFLGTDREFRRQHIEGLKNIYYNTLKQFLKYFRIDLDEIFPRKDFELQVRDALEYGLLSSMFLLPFVFINDNEIPNPEFKTDAHYQERIEGIVDDFIEMGYF